MAICMGEAEAVLQDGDSKTQENVKMLLIGETGSGKTSLLELIKNYEKPAR